jgi:hypothetical protein
MVFIGKAGLMRGMKRVFGRSIVREGVGALPIVRGQGG